MAITAENIAAILNAIEAAHSNISHNATAWMYGREIAHPHFPIKLQSENPAVSVDIYPYTGDDEYVDGCLYCEPSTGEEWEDKGKFFIPVWWKRDGTCSLTPSSEGEEPTGWFVSYGEDAESIEDALKHHKDVMMGRFYEVRYRNWETDDYEYETLYGHQLEENIPFMGVTGLL